MPKNKRPNKFGSFVFWSGEGFEPRPRRPERRANQAALHPPVCRRRAPDKFGCKSKILFEPDIRYQPELELIPAYVKFRGWRTHPVPIRPNYTAHHRYAVTST